MAGSDAKQIPSDLVRSWSKFIEPSLTDSFEHECAAATLQTIDETLGQFFATWSTSLIGSDLARLKSLSEDNRLRGYVNTLIIEDDSARLDPWMIGDVPILDLSHHAWPRSEAGIIIEGEMDAGLSELGRILRERLLRPTKIQIRDHQIPNYNFRLCPEMVNVRDLIHVASPNAQIAVSVDGLAKRIVEYSDLALTSVEMRAEGMSSSSPASWDPLVSKLGSHVSLMVPKKEEVTIELLEGSDSKETSFSMLHTAEVLVKRNSASYWLEHAFYKATNLETLSLTVRESPGRWLKPGFVVSTLVTFALHFRTTSSTTISEEDLLAMIASSKGSLKHIYLRSISLTGNSWRNVLTFIAREFRNLRSFDLGFLREDQPGDQPRCTLDFSDAKALIPEGDLPNLNLIERNRLPHKPVASLKYDGPNAEAVLTIIAAQGKPGTFRPRLPHDDGRAE